MSGWASADAAVDGAWEQLPAAKPDVAGLFRRPAWQQHAACRGVGPDVFFPERGADVATAKQLCVACVVRGQCLAASLERSERYGIWGGTTDMQRRQVRKIARRIAGKPPAGPFGREV